MSLLSEMLNFFGSAGKEGPLFQACRRSAEHRHFGGHSPETRRARLREEHWEKLAKTRPRRLGCEIEGTL